MLTEFEVQDDESIEGMYWLVRGKQRVTWVMESDDPWDALERVADALNDLALKPKIVREPAGDATYLVG